ncbi:hypothetical protein PIB30_067221, partial [Stylosanthes scabra]|nr:hypothetical protein [Stylosanthes scabra]
MCNTVNNRSTDATGEAIIDGEPRLSSPSAGLVRMNIKSIKNFGIGCNPSNTSCKSFTTRIRNSIIVGHDPNLIHVLPPNIGEIKAVSTNNIIIIVPRRTKATVMAGGIHEGIRKEEIIMIHLPLTVISCSQVGSFV